MDRVAVIGASGFVGTAVVEYLQARGVEVLPFVGSTGNSWQLLRRGLKPQVLDVLDAAAVERHLVDCPHVVNCMRGADEVMIKGLANLIGAAQENGVRRFVHLSSVAVYGDFPSAAAVDESGPTTTQRGTYGWTKLQQDQMIERAAKRGLPSVILCPPNIFGPSSAFLIQLLDALIRGEFLLVADEPQVCATVDVRNLAHACFVALDAKTNEGQRYFITDDERVSWPHLVERLTRAAQLDVTVPACSTVELKRMVQRSSPTQTTSLWRSVKHLVSSDVRQALRKDPNIARFDTGLRRLVGKLGSSVEDRLRLAIEGPAPIPRMPPTRQANVRLSGQQLRGVAHSCARAKADLAYRPVCTFEESMAAFERWLVATRGMSEPGWQLRKGLFGYH
jgi:nucleoside-diphosphate-sugar epimerase